MESLDLAVKSVVDEIAVHRAGRERKRGGAFPKDIWDKLVALANAYGAARVARATRVDGRSLRARMEAPDDLVSLKKNSAVDMNVAPKGDRAAQNFVECWVGADGPSKMAWTIEVESALGERMRIQASNFKNSDLPLLIRGFLGR